jgi:glycosyltransferase involved in cell wall biosynthesis
LVAEVVFAIPGDVDTPTGGYRYDRRVIDELRALRWDVKPLRLPGDFPAPSQASLQETERQFACAPVDALLLVDGLAFGALPISLLDRVPRKYVALVHHPLGLETGITRERADFLLKTERAALTRAQRVIVTSKPTAALLFSDFGVAKEKIIVAEPGTETALRAKSSGGTPCLLSVGAVNARKGYETLVVALAKIADLQWESRIVGTLDRDLPTAAAVKAAINSAKLDARIKLLGKLDEAALAAEYDQATLFVLPSHFEGFGMAFTEAMARGLPVVAGDAGAAPTTVPDDAGILVPPGNADALAAVLRRLLTDPTELRRRSDAAWRHAQNFPRWCDTANAIAGALTEALR